MYDVVGIFSVQANLLYTQYCFNMLPINYMLDPQKLSLLNMQREHFLRIVRCLYAVSGCSRFNELCRDFCIYFHLFLVCHLHCIV